MRSVGTTSQAKRMAGCLLVVVASLWQPSKGIAAAAFAMGRNAHGSWGSGVHDYPTASEAQQEVLRRCSMRGPAACSIVATFSRACFAIAVQVGRNGYGWVTRPTISEARSAVLSQCLAHGMPCEVRVAMCDSGDSRGVRPTSTPFPTPAPAFPSVATRPQSPGNGCDRYPELCQ